MKKFLVLLIMLMTAVMVTSAVADEPTVYTSGDYKYVLLEDGTAEITKYTGDASELVIPAELDGHSITSIGRASFYRCLSANSIVLPDSITYISDLAFAYCRGMTSITLPDSVTSIGDYAFCGCDALTSINLPNSVTHIGNEAFYTCFALTSITIPDSVTSIGINPFRSCDALTDIVVSPDHPVLTTIDGVLFNKAEKQLICYPIAYTSESYSIPQGTLVIGDYAFDYSNCQTIIIPDSVTHIGNNAFSATDLSTVIIPNSVTFIGNSAFHACRSLTSITIPDSVTSIGNYTFRSCDSLTTITVTPGSYAAQYCIDNGLPYTYPDAAN